jgi:uncharacterized phage protein gp47/JayE
MATVFPRPTLPNLIQRVTQQIQAALPGTDPTLRRSVCGIVAIVLAQELVNEYAYLDFIATQFFVSSASGIYLDLKGNPLGIYRQEAVPAAGNVSFSGTNGYTVPAGAVLETSNGGEQYVLGAAVTISGGVGTGSVTAITGGSLSNQPAGTSLTLSVAVAGINAQVVVASGGLTGGIDMESDTSYRQAILSRMQQPPQGGAKRDYVTWVKEATAGVTRAWVWPQNRGGGTVDYSFVFDGRGVGNILPLSGDLTTVQTYVNAQMPADVSSAQNQTLTIDSIAVTVTNCVVATGYTLAQVQANISASLLNLFAATTPGNAPYGDGIQPGSTGGALPVERISDAIAQSLGVISFDLTAPTADIASATYHLAQLGALTVTAP